MAKYEGILKGNFQTILETIENGIINGSASASLEDSSNFQIDDCLCAILVFERYSYTGSNRLSLNVTLFGKNNDTDNKVYISAVTAGGSQGLFFKINTFGEEAFLDKLLEIVEPLFYEDDN